MKIPTNQTDISLFALFLNATLGSGYISRTKAAISQLDRFDRYPNAKDRKLIYATASTAAAQIVIEHALTELGRFSQVIPLDIDEEGGVRLKGDSCGLGLITVILATAMHFDDDEGYEDDGTFSECREISEIPEGEFSDNWNTLVQLCSDELHDLLVQRYGNSKDLTFSKVSELSPELTSKISTLVQEQTPELLRVPLMPLLQAFTARWATNYTMPYEKMMPFLSEFLISSEDTIA